MNTTATIEVVITVMKRMAQKLEIKQHHPMLCLIFYGEGIFVVINIIIYNISFYPREECQDLD